MVIQCPDCRTRFNLADEKVKPEGIKVRCARCKQVFAVRREEPTISAPPEPAAEVFQEEIPTVSVASGAAFASPRRGAPPPWQPPVEEPQWNGDPLSDEGSEDFGGEEVVDEKIGEDSDEFFPFQEAFETETEPEDSDVALDPFGDAPLFAEESNKDESPDFSFAREMDSAEAKEDEPGVSLLDDDFFGTEGLAPTPEVPGEESPGEDDFSFASPPSDAGTDLYGEPPEFSFDEVRPDDGFSFPEAEKTPSADLSWTSTQDDGDNPFAAETPPREKDEFDFGDSEPEPSPSPASAAPAPPVTTPLPTPPEEAPGVESAAKKVTSVPPKRRGKNPVSALLVVLIVLLVALAGAAAYFFTQGGPEEMARVLDRFTAQDPPPPAPSQIRVTELRGVFVRNGHEGQLFVISGVATNDHTEARSAISLKGILYNEKGEALLQQTVFAGNPFSEEALKQLPFAKIEEGMNNQFGDSLSNLNVAPGKSIPFTIVFKGLPANLAEFTVEVADSRPGSKQ